LFDKWWDKFEGASKKKGRMFLPTPLSFMGPKGSSTNLHYTYTVFVVGNGGDCLNAAKDILLLRELDHLHH
jgi:hypothetical protein